MKNIHATRCAFLLIALFLTPVGSSSAEEVIGEHVEGLAAGDLLPLREWTHEFVVVEGEARGEYRTVSFTRDPETENGWIMNFAENNKAYLKQQANGDIVLHRLDELQYERSVRVEPPLLFLPAEIEPKYVHESSGRVLVYELGEEGSPNEGSYTSRIQRISRHTFYTRAGAVQGYLLDFAIAIDLTLADVDVRFEYGVSPGRGLLYRRSHWVLEALGVFDRSGARAILLEEM